MTGFTCISNDVIANSALSDKAVRVYLLLKMHNNETNGCFPGQDTIAREMLASIPTVQRALRELEQYGLIERERRGKKQTNLYRFPSDPSPVINQNELLIIHDASPVINHSSDPSVVMGSDPSVVMGPYEQDKDLTRENDINTPTSYLYGECPDTPQEKQESLTLKMQQPKQEKPRKGSDPWNFVDSFHGFVNVEMKITPKELHQAKQILEMGISVSDIPDLYQDCSWSSSGIDIGTMLVQAPKFVIKKNGRPPIHMNGNGCRNGFYDKNGRPTVQWTLNRIQELEAQGL